MQVRVCRTCYDVYRRLDSARAGVNHVPDDVTKTSVQESLASIDTNPAGSIRGAAAAAGAARLSADLTAMLRDVDTKSGKLGIEAGIIWRRRLRYSCGILIVASCESSGG